MKFRKALIIFSAIIIVILNIYVYKELISREQEITALKGKIISLEKQIAEVNNVTDEKVVSKTEVVLKEGNFDIELFSSYNTETSSGELEYIFKPAFGPLCSLNRSAVENTNNLTIIGQENEYLTRISVEGVIPTWVLESTKGSLKTSFTEKQMYVIKGSDVYLTPENNSKKVNVFPVGKAVRVLDEYDDWFYIDAFRSVDSNEINNGWIRKSSLGYYESLKTNIGVEVKIKEGYEPEWLRDYAQLSPYGLWGEIHEETEDEFYLWFHGASGMNIKKEHVESFLHEEK